MVFNDFSGLGSPSLSFGMPLIHALGLIFGTECSRTVGRLQPQLGMGGSILLCRKAPNKASSLLHCSDSRVQGQLPFVIAPIRLEPRGGFKANLI